MDAMGVVDKGQEPIRIDKFLVSRTENATNGEFHNLSEDEIKQIIRLKNAGKISSGIREITKKLSISTDRYYKLKLTACNKWVF